MIAALGLQLLPNSIKQISPVLGFAGEHMRVITGFERLDRDPLQQTSAVVIGNFDGCHKGHQQLLGKTREIASALGTLSVVVTFLPHPEIAFGRLGQGDLLFPLEQKLLALQELGFDAVVIQPFDQAFADTPHDVFYQRDLKKRLGAKAIVVGENFRFGSKRLGNGSFLTEAGGRDNLVVHLGDHVLGGGLAISSTRTRDLLRQGDVAAVASALGRPYALYGKIVQGDRIGRTIGFPTANLLAAEQLIPAHGVYAGWLQIGPDVNSTPIIHPQLRSLTPAVFNIGVRPTVNGKGLRIEAHGLDRDLGETYGQDAVFFLVHRLRSEKQFSAMDALRKQIQIDVETARVLLAT